MARRVFFSFYYKRDIFRVSQVRNSGIVKGNYEKSGFIDHADWESLERQGNDAIKRWIDGQLNGASVTVVLIGAETFNRPWVNYEIQQSYADGKGMLGIYIHQLKDPRTGLTDYKGRNPFENIYITNSNPRRYLNEFYPTYDWVDNDGYNNFASWVEAAARRANR
jgi:Thoeris protein ThsB, TIR-like domain